jgi:quercetin dioxygenase-like cupin family protein
MAMTGVRVIGPMDGKVGSLGGVGVRFMIDGAESGGGFALVEHPLEPHALAAPMHRHHREDEYSYVLEGRVGASLDGEVVYGKPGDLIVKPRGQWHTFWNPDAAPARLLEIISPAGFERFFDTLTGLAERGELNPAAMAALAGEYGAELDFDSLPRLVVAHQLVFPGVPSPSR